MAGITVMGRSGHAATPDMMRLVAGVSVTRPTVSAAVSIAAELPQ